MTLIDQLCSVAAAYGEAKGISQARVSTLVFGEGTKLPAIVEGGADLTTARFERAMQWFSDHWPDAAWPDNVPRPDPADISDGKAA